MRKSALPLMVSESRVQEVYTGIPVSELANLIEDWLIYGEDADHSKRTTASRRHYLNRLLQFLWDKQHATCGRRELRQFFAELSHASTGEPLRPSSAETFYRNIGAFFNWLIEEEYLAVSPMKRVPKPNVPKDLIQPFSDEQMEAIIQAAKDSHFGERNHALMLFLLDTWVRSTELAELKIKHLDFNSKRVEVMGKDDKLRTVFFGKRARQALYRYIPTGRMADRERPLFVAETGRNFGEPLTRSGVYQIVQDCCKAAGIKARQSGPHMIRRTGAVMYIRDGGDMREVQMLLGHESLATTGIYTKLAEADLQESHAKHSPADRLGRRRKS